MSSSLPADDLPPGPTTDSRHTRLHGFGRLMARIGRYLTHSPLGVVARRRLNRQVEERRVRLELPVPAGRPLPRIAFLSDLHAGFFNTPRDLDRIAARAAAFEPDLVVLGGDLIDSHGSDVFLLGMALSRLEPRLGIYAVRGNHEYFHPEDLPLWTSFLEHKGVRVLVNEGVRVDFEGTGIWIAGIDDWREGLPDIDGALAGRRPDDLVLLASHHPDAFPEAVARGVDLQLSGHTHGGQVRFGAWTPITHSKYDYYDGLYRREGGQLYVSRGGGTTVLPIRIGAMPEVALLELVATGTGARESAVGSERRVEGGDPPAPFPEKEGAERAATRDPGPK